MAVKPITNQRLVNKENVIIMPKVFNFEEAAGFSVAAQTAYVSLVERANIQAGNTLLILGATGGVGLAAIQLGVMLGAKVIAICSNKKKQITKNYSSSVIFSNSTFSSTSK